jgi:hypothetical protein
MIVAEIERAHAAILRGKSVSVKADDLSLKGFSIVLSAWFRHDQFFRPSAQV